MTTPRQPPLTEEEFAAIETMLADLLAQARDDHEETAILHIHTRVAAIFERDAAARAARRRLLALRGDQPIAKAAMISRSSDRSLP